MQHPAIARARGEKGPRALALACLHDVVIAARIAAVPPAALDALGAGEDARGGAAQWNCTRQQPKGAKLPRLRCDALSSLPGQSQGEGGVCRALLPLPLAGEGWGKGGA